jgi:hypothetical protein
MAPVSFHDFFVGCATVAGALIGLLFVAISVSPEKLTGDVAHTEHQVRAGAAFSALVSTLVIALVALLPGASLDDAATIVAGAGLATTIGLIVVLYREHQQKIRRIDVRMLAILLLLYGLQLAIALQLDASPHNLDQVTRLGGLCIAFFLFGIARSWQLVGARNLSLSSTLAAVIHRAGSEDLHLEGGQRGTAMPPASQDDPTRRPEAP